MSKCSYYKLPGVGVGVTSTVDSELIVGNVLLLLTNVFTDDILLGIGTMLVVEMLVDVFILTDECIILECCKMVDNSGELEGIDLLNINIVL